MLHVFKSHYNRFRRFSFVGIMNTGIDFSVFSILFYIMDIPYVIAHIAAFFVALSNSFLLNSLWTFKNLKRDQLVRQVVVFVVVGLFGLGLSTTVIYIMADYIPVFLAKVAATCVSMVWNYFGSWLFVFKK